MSIVLFHGGGAGDFSLDGSLRPITSRNTSTTYPISCGSGDIVSPSICFRSFPGNCKNASNGFNDEFSVLHAIVGLQEYEQARAFSESTEHTLAFKHIAATITEIGPYVRFVAVALDPNRKPQLPDTRSLTAREIDKLVYKYIGVNGGYLGDFSYRTHHEFYINLDLNIDPNKLEGTTRERFTQILSAGKPDVQARIL